MLTDRYLDGIPADSRAARGARLSTRDLLTEQTLAKVARAERDRQRARADARPAGAGLGAARPARDVGADRREQRRAARGERRRRSTGSTSPTTSWPRSTATRSTPASTSGRARAARSSSRDCDRRPRAQRMLPVLRCSDADDALATARAAAAAGSRVVELTMSTPGVEDAIAPLVADGLVVAVGRIGTRVTSPVWRTRERRWWYLLESTRLRRGGRGGGHRGDPRWVHRPRTGGRSGGRRDS